MLESDAKKSKPAFLVVRGPQLAFGVAAEEQNAASHHFLGGGGANEGGRSALEENKPKFLTFCKSVHP